MLKRSYFSYLINQKVLVAQFTASNARITSSISSTAGPSFIHFNHSEQTFLFYESVLQALGSQYRQLSFLLVSPPTWCKEKHINVYAKENQDLRLHVSLGSTRDADLANIFVHVVNFQLTSSIKTWSGKHLQSSISSCRFNGYLKICSDIF